MEDDKRGAWRCLGGQQGDVGEQVATVDRRRVAAGGLDGGRQALLAPRLARPEQAFQPADVGVPRHVQRVQVEPGPPADLGHHRGEQDRAGRASRRRERARAGSVPVSRLPL